MIYESPSQKEQVINLIRLFQSGNEEVFTELYEKTYRLVYTTCCGIINSEEDAKDVTQEVFLTIYQKLGTLENPAIYSSWMVRIATNRSLDFLRSRKNLSYTDDDAELDVMANDWTEADGIPDSFLEQDEKREIINRVLKENLTDVQYMTLFMHYYNEMSVEEIAAAMNCPEGTVKTRLKSARSKFKESLESYLDENKLVLGAVPFLSKFFTAQMTSLSVPHVPFGMVMPHVATTAAGTAAKAAKTGIMTTTAGKVTAVILSATVLTAVGVGTTIGIKHMNHRDIDLNEYIDYKIEGYSGYADLTYSIDYDNLKADYSALTDVSDDELAQVISGQWNNVSGISNDEQLVFGWDVSAGSFEEDHNITFLHDDLDVKVSGLPEVTMLDPFDYVDVEIKGADHIAKAVMTKKGVPPVDLVYEFDKDSKLTNGDTVTLSVKAGKEDYLDQGYILTQTSRSYEVNDLTEYLTAADELPDELVAHMKTEGVDIHKNWATNAYNIDSYEFQKMIFVYCKDRNVFNHNYCYVVYKVHTKSGISFYTSIYYINITADEEGNVKAKEWSYPSMVFGDNTVQGPGSMEMYEGYTTINGLDSGIRRGFERDTGYEFIFSER